MALNPAYGPGVENQLDAIEQDPEKVSLWRSFVEVLDRVLDQPEDPRNRRYALASGKGVIWRVPVPAPEQMNDHVLLWYRDDTANEAVFLYAGTWPPTR